MAAALHEAGQALFGETHVTGGSAGHDIEGTARLLRLLGNEARLRIMLRVGEGEVSVADLEAELGVRQPNLSQHLAELRDAGLLASRRDGRTVLYSLTGRDASLTVGCLCTLMGRGTGKALRSTSTEVAKHARSALGSAVFARIEHLG
jgi:DNA-binding transcriptional ArsR family regulator